MKLFTIGDSLSQGFMSAAAARTDLCYSTLIAECLGIPVGSYAYPDWPKGGYPVNIERVLRKLNKKFGSDIWGPIEWPMAIAQVGSMLDDVEDYYERGDRAANRAVSSPRKYFHNVAVWGYDVADAEMITPEVCQVKINAPKSEGGDGFFAQPSQSFFRTALDVLNPSKNPAFANHNALTWLDEHCQSRHEPGGVENLLLWLGANNALATILGLNVIQTPTNPALMPKTYEGREKYNLWHPAVFKDEYQKLMAKVDASMSKNAGPWNVFVANVPPVSIAPIAKGVGDTYELDDPFGIVKPKARYSKYYTYFMFEADAAQRGTVPKLNVAAVYQIDQYIAEYNKVIAAEIAALNAAHGAIRYHLVDICTVLLQAAFKRNGGQPTYQFPQPVKDLFPIPNTKYYFADEAGSVTEGGLFSLDGVHPTAIGQGIIAYEFMKIMNGVGVHFPQGLDWKRIIGRDDLWNRPITLMKELYQHQKLIELILRFTKETGSAMRKSGM